MFLFGLACAFLNLILYVLLEPILSDRLSELGVEEDSMGHYFFIQPFTYSGVSLLVDHFFLSRIHKRVCLIIGFFIFGLGFILVGPSRLVTPFFPEEYHLTILCVGLFTLGIGCSLSFVPIFPELIESVKHDYQDRLSDLNNTVSGMMNAFYVSASLGHLSAGFFTHQIGFVQTCEMFSVFSFIYAIVYSYAHAKYKSEK